MTTTTMTMPMTASSTTTPAFPGGVSGTPRVMLRLEGAAMLIGAAALYAHLGAGWGLFFGLFLAPDLSFFGYLAGPRIGAIAYNAMHGYVGPALLAALSFTLLPGALPIALIWAAHVGFDRMLGYGLKYGTAFGHTHLGVVGKNAKG